MKSDYRQKIADEFRNCVEETIKRLNSEATYRPFHSALLSDEALFWSRFERSFSTSFGQRVVEEIARLVVLSNGALEARRQKETFIELDNSYDIAISEHIQKLRNGQRLGWNDTLAELRQLSPSGKKKTLRIISDLWWRENETDHYISLKTVKPNIDQTAVAKEDCLRLALSDPKCKVYFGLPYNPYGKEKRDYSHNPPMKIFDFHNDPVVLIGKEMWDKLGGNGCYEELLRIAKEVGKETKQSIMEMFYGR